MIFSKFFIFYKYKYLNIYFIFVKILENHDTLQAVFHKGADYLGSGSFEQIAELIEKMNGVDLISNSFEILKNNHFPTLTLTQYNNLVNFSKSQLKY